MKDAPWFVDFFAPAIEDNLHELHGESIDQNNEDENGGEKDRTGLTSSADKLKLGGSWKEVQREMMMMMSSKKPKFVPSEGTARPAEQQKMERQESYDQKESNVIYSPTWN